MAVSEVENDHLEESSDSHTAGGSSKDESVWEYEYDENETEDYYFTMDLSTHPSEAAIEADQLNLNNKKSTSKAYKYGITRNVRPGANDSTPKISLSGSQKQAFGARDDVVDLQMLRLHAEKPLIKFGDDLFSCHWSTDLGTSFHIARPGIAERPLRPGHVLDVIGISRARLTGKPATLRKRKQILNGNLAGSSVADAIPIDDDDVEVVAGAPSDILRDGTPTVSKSIAQFAAAREKASNPAVRAQASFLERFAAIKRRKGEKDVIPLHGVKEYRVQRTSEETHATDSAKNGASDNVNENTS